MPKLTLIDNNKLIKINRAGTSTGQFLPVFDLITEQAILSGDPLSKGYTIDGEMLHFAFDNLVAALADKTRQLETGRKIESTGDVVWEVDFDGSSDVSATANIQQGVINELMLDTDLIDKINYVTPIIPDADVVDSSSLEGFLINGRAINYAFQNIKANRAAIADRLENDYTISMTGDVEWSVAFDGSGNVTATSEIQPGVVTQTMLDDDLSSIIDEVEHKAEFDGSNAIGLWDISITGNAATVTNGVYTDVSYSNPDWIDSLAGDKITGDIVGNAGSATQLLNARNINSVSFDGTANITVPVNLANRTTNESSYLIFSSQATGNRQVYTNADIRYNPNTGQLSVISLAGEVVGNAATASQLKDERSISSTGHVNWTVQFDGSQNATAAATIQPGVVTQPMLNTALSNKINEIDNKAESDGSNATGLWSISITGNAATVSNGVYTTGSYSDPSWITSIAGSKIDGDIAGNSGSATQLQTARSINGVSFNGTANINVPVNLANRTTNESGHVIFTGTTATGNRQAYTNTNYRFNPSTGTLTVPNVVSSLTGNADTATQLSNARTIGMTGHVIWTSTGFDGSGNVTGTSTIQNEVISESMLDLNLQEKVNRSALNNTEAIRDPLPSDNADDGYGLGSMWINTTTDTYFRLVGFDGTDAVWINSSLTADDLGSMAFQNANTVDITGGMIAGVDLTSVTDQAGARSAIGAGTVNSVGLTAPTGFNTGSAVTGSGNLTLSFASGYSLPTTANQTNWTTAYNERHQWNGGSTNLDAGNARISLGLVPGVDVLAFSSSLNSIAGLTTSANQMLYTTGSGVYNTTTITTLGRSIVGSATTDAALDNLGFSIVGKAFSNISSETGVRYLRWSGTTETATLSPINTIKGDLSIQNVDNTSDADKPISTATQSALDGKVGTGRTITAGAGLTGGGNLSSNRTIVLGTPSTVTGSTSNASTGNTHTHEIDINKSDVGLGNVDNTSDVNKPVSTAVATALTGKVDKVTGKQLSTEDYTTAEKNKLAGIAAGAQVNTVNSVAGKTGNVTLVKGDVGLGNVDNTSDANKPVSTATQLALDDKLNLSDIINDTAMVGNSQVNPVTQYALKHYVQDTITNIGAGDMNKSVYDPTGKNTDAFNMDNMVEGTNTKILTNVERGLIASSLQPSDILNQANLGDNDPNKAPSQQSVKTYVDTGLSTKQSIIKEGVSATAIGTANKVVTLTDSGYIPVAGDLFAIQLTNGNNAAAITLNINGSGLYPVRAPSGNAAIQMTVSANHYLMCYFTGGDFRLFGAQINQNTQLTLMSQSELNTGTSTTNRGVSAALMTYMRGLWISNDSTLGGTNPATDITPSQSALQGYIQDVVTDLNLDSKVNVDGDVMTGPLMMANTSTQYRSGAEGFDVQYDSSSKTLNFTFVG